MVDKLRVHQATWITTKLVLLREIEFLDKENKTVGMSLHNAMMSIKHPASPWFSLFHSIDKTLEGQLVHHHMSKVCQIAIACNDSGITPLSEMNAGSKIWQSGNNTSAKMV